MPSPAIEGEREALFFRSLTIGVIPDCCCCCCCWCCRDACLNEGVVVVWLFGGIAGSVAFSGVFSARKLVLFDGVPPVRRCASDTPLPHCILGLEGRQGSAVYGVSCCCCCCCDAGSFGGKVGSPLLVFALVRPTTPVAVEFAEAAAPRPPSLARVEVG